MTTASPRSPQRPDGAQAVNPVTADANAGFIALLNIEKETREARTEGELRHLMANETRKLTRARQIVVFAPNGKSFYIVAISGQPAVERSAPLVQGLESAVAGLSKDAGLTQEREFDLYAYEQKDAEILPRYPFRFLLWSPLLARNGTVLGGLLLAREQAWNSSDILVAKRLSETYAHAQSLLLAEPRLAARLAAKTYGARRALIGGIAVLCALLFVPVPMTTLAPFEITPEDPVIISAPIEGVIEQILVEPSAHVEAGQPLVRYTDTALRNRLEVAEREVQVSEARFKQASQLAFNDVQGRHDMSVAEHEQQLKAAERDFARDMFERSVIRAPRPGVAVFSDKKALIGKPVSTGERLMQIADPQHIEATIDVAAADSIALQLGASIKLYLDNDPLNSRAAKVSEAEYQARPRPGNILAYRVVGKLDTPDNPPRLGARGTAQIFGNRVRLAYYLFRRPLTAIRQWAGL